MESLKIGGMESVLVDIANMLVEKGHDVTIITYMESKEENFIAELDERIHFIYREKRTFPIMSKLPYFHM